MTCLFIRSHKIICNHCNNYFDWLISVAKELLYLREAVSVLFGKCKGKGTIVAVLELKVGNTY